MLILLSPSKSFTAKKPPLVAVSSEVLFKQQTEKIVSKLQKLSKTDLQKQLSISKNLSDLNYRRYQQWDGLESKPALWSYSGDVYNGLNAFNFNTQDVEFAQKNLAIISGLYGIVRPLDDIKPYRLEMKIPLKGSWGKDLYQAWTNKIGDYIVQQGHEEVLLCASKEYAKAVPTSERPYHVIVPRFFQKTTDGLKEKGLFAKYARGALAHWAIKHRLSKITDLQNFSEDGFSYSNQLSTESELVFIVPDNFSLKGRFTKL